MTAKYPLVLFDFDGTIVDSSEGIVNCVIYSLEKHGIIETDREKLLYFIGPPLFDAFKDIYGTDDDTAYSLVAAYRERYRPTGFAECSVYPGMAELLRRLRSSGCITGVASSKPQEFVEKILDFKSISDCFDVVAGTTFANIDADKTAVLRRAVKEATGQEEAVAAMVGDRKFDIEAAKNIGATAIGVSFGFGSEKELTDAGADFIAHNTAELERLLLRQVP